MQVFAQISELQDYLSDARRKGWTIGFVPTMGALHQGHLSLVEAAQQQTDLTIVSIFVNPTQFNNPADLENYPRTEEQDLKLLAQQQCDVVFMPDFSAIYPEDYQTIDLNLHPIDVVMEGKFRPGHFKGVINVVYRLFEILQPNCAFFGKKDFQQVALIKAMVRRLNLPVKIIACDTLRETSGLAMSSRNIRLSSEERIQAVVLYQTLALGQQLALEYTPAETLQFMLGFFGKSGLKLEYLEIVEPSSLFPLSDEWVPGATACIVAYCGSVRLIDNMELIPIRAV